MNTNQSKPSLEALLQSKKYDLPSDDFWNVLQDRVKGKALASLSEPSFPQRFIKPSFVFLPVLALALFYSLSFYSDTPSLSSPTISIADTSITANLQEKGSSQDFQIIQDLESLDHDYTNTTSVVFLSLNDKSSYAETNLELSHENSFEIQYLSNFDHHQDDLLSQYTF